MIRGTTPTLEFVIPLDTGQLAEAFVTVSQNDELVFEKPLMQCQCDGNKLSVQLTQEESLKLTSGICVVFALVAKTLNGERVESNKFIERVYETTKDGVI